VCQVWQCYIVVSAVLVVLCGQTDRRTESQTERRMTTIAYSATIVSFSFVFKDKKAHSAWLKLVFSFYLYGFAVFDLLLDACHR